MSRLLSISSTNPCNRVFRPLFWFVIFTLFELHGKLFLLLHSFFSQINMNAFNIQLRLEVFAGDGSESKNEQSDRDHQNDPRCGTIVAFLDFNDFWIELTIIFHNLLDSNVLVNGLLFKLCSDVWSKNILLSRNSVNVYEFCVGGGFGDYDCLVTISRYSAI